MDRLGGRVVERGMSAEFFRRMALQCRDLMAVARTEAAKRQLRIWIDEFEAQAEGAERDKQRNPHGHDRC
jgi:hypothetical protein